MLIENPIYNTCIDSCRNGNMTLSHMIELGAKWMKKSKLHHHFFKDRSFFTIAQSLAFHALGLEHATDDNPELLTRKISENEAKKMLGLFEKRIVHRLPVEYLTNQAYYLGNKFYVNENVLVPRSIMNTRFEDFLNEIEWENYRVLDLCTGSGCIGISLALLHPKIQVDLVDISTKALEVAQININRHGLNDRVKCIESDLFANVHNQYDLIITNPPYVSTREYNMSPEEFKREPKIALESGKDGLDIIHQILAQAKNYLNPQGKLIAEIGFTAAQRVKKKYRKVPFKWYKYRRPSGHESFFGMHGVFECPAKGLPE